MIKRVAFLVPTLQVGGMERVMSEIVSYASRENIECYLVLYGLSKDVFYTLPPSVIICRNNLKYKECQRAVYTFLTMRYLRRTVRRISPDTILSFGEIWNSFVILSLLGLKYPIFISDRCSPTKSFGIIHDYLRKKLYPRTQGIIAQTKKAKDIYLTQFKHSNIAVIGNPMDVERKVNMAVRENIVITVGRLIDTKHHDRIIDIFKEVMFDDWRLFIVGEDAMKQQNSIVLKKKILEENLGNRVFLLGSQKNVFEYLERSKIFVFTSSSEGFPNVIGEAMAAGLPVVAYDCIAGPSEMVDGGKNGFLVDTFDDVKFGNRLLELMQDDILRKSFAEDARKTIKRFNSEIICKKIIDFILDENIN